MENIMYLLIIIFIIAIAPLFVGSILLQVLLSKKKNNLWGLIIPIFCFILSLTIIIGRTIVSRSFIMLFLFNIPTLIYLEIYIGYYKHRKELMKGNSEKLL